MCFTLLAMCRTGGEIFKRRLAYSVEVVITTLQLLYNQPRTAVKIFYY